MKTKKLLLAIMLLVATITAKAQVGGSPSGFIAIDFGTGYPMGNFSSTDATNPSAGFAQTGYDFNVAYAFPIKHSNWGIAAMVDYSGNSFDVQSYLNDAVAANPGYNWFVQTQGNWSATTILIGGFATIPVNRFSFDFRIMGGVMFATIPTIAVAANNNTTDSSGNPESITAAAGIGTANSTTFAYDFGFGIRYSCSKHIGIMINFDYLGANPTFNTTEGVAVNVDDNGNSYQQSAGGPATLSIPISLFKATIGIGYQF